MPVLRHYVVEHYATEKLLLGSGAERCVCPKNFAPECPIEPMDDEDMHGISYERLEIWRSRHWADVSTDRGFYFLAHPGGLSDRSACQLVVNYGQGGDDSSPGRTVDYPNQHSDSRQVVAQGLSRSDFRPWLEPEWQGRLLGVHR